MNSAGSVDCILPRFNLMKKVAELATFIVLFLLGASLRFGSIFGELFGIDCVAF